MAKYWIYLDDAVVGPFAVDKLIRMRGFSRQTPVCVDDNSGKPGAWITCADIPELAAVFKAADLYHEIPPPRAPKTPPKPVPATPKPPRPARVRTPEPVQKAASGSAWKWILPLLVMASVTGAWGFTRYQKMMIRKEHTAARHLVEDQRLPGNYPTFGSYITAKDLRPRWDFEKTTSGLLNTTVSWFGENRKSGISTVYGFEVNLDAQMVRPLNSAAARLMSDGFGGETPKAASSSSASSAAPKPKSAEAKLTEALDERRAAVESGDFGTVWKSFSRRKRSEMVAGGISESGFVRLQTITRGVESEVKQTVLKKGKDEDGAALVLLRQTQAKHPDLFLKQRWTEEDGTWKLDNEEKRSADAGSSAAPAAPAVPATPANSANPANPLLKLPGLSN